MIDRFKTNEGGRGKGTPGQKLVMRFVCEIKIEIERIQNFEL